MDEELREIETVLSRAKQRDRFEIRPQYATRPSNIQQALLDYNPQIVQPAIRKCRQRRSWRISTR